MLSRELLAEMIREVIADDGRTGVPASTHACAARRLDEQELELLERVARRARAAVQTRAIAMDNASLYAAPTIHVKARGH